MVRKTHTHWAAAVLMGQRWKKTGLENSTPSNAEWPEIRASLDENFPEAAAWTAWQHEQPSTTTLPSGAEVATDRGAEQGDDDGPGLVQRLKQLSRQRVPGLQR